MRGRRVRIPVGEGAVSAILCAPRAPSGVGLVLGPGAGSDLASPILVAVATALAARGHTTLRYNFLYREHGKKVPDRPPVLEATTHAVALWLRARGVTSLFAGGKSMGGRIASICASKGLDLRGLVFLGYPLHPAGKPEKLRDQHLYEVTCPMLFVQGTRDDLCDLGLLRPVLARVGDRATLHVIEDGDHSLEVRRSSGRTNAEVLAEIIDLIDAWILARA